MSDLWNVAADPASSSFQAQVHATFERFVADYLDPRGAGEPVNPAVVGAVFAAILPVLNSAAATPEFSRAMELTARERFTEPVYLLWEPLQEILDLVRPGHVWQFEAGVGSVGQVPAQLPRTAGEPTPADR